MLKDAIDSIGGFFSRSFLLGCFLPAFIVLALNLALAILALQAWNAVSFAGQPFKIPTLATGVSLGALASVSLAFIAAPFLPLMRHWVEGGLLPGPIRKALVARGEATVKSEQAAIDAWARAHLSLSQTLAANRQALRAARGEGEKVKGAGHPDLIEVAVAAVDRLKTAVAEPHENQPADFAPGGRLDAAVKAAFTALEPALAKNRSGGDPAKLPSDALSLRLDAAHVAFSQLCDGALRSAMEHLSNAQNKLSGRYAPGDVRATRFGNFSAVMEAYPQRAYGVAFDFISPRLDLVLTTASGSFDGFDRAKIQVDSALMLLSLTTLSLGGWLIGLVIEHRHPALFLGIALAAPLLLWIMYELLVESQKGFADRFQAAVDGSRLNLLLALNAPWPTDPDAERAAWQALQKLSSGHRGLTFAFKPEFPAPAALPQIAPGGPRA